MREEKRTQRCNGPGYVYILVVGAVAAVRIDREKICLLQHDFNAT